jgi:hypothetical protein
LSGAPLFANKRFRVDRIEFHVPIVVAGASFLHGYSVTNVETDVVEVKTPGLVEAITYAENSDRVLEARPWEWARQPPKDESDDEDVVFSHAHRRLS